MIKVAKFGGSSVANARQFQKVEAILKEDPTRKIVVLSACGKSEENPHKVTDLLYLCEANQRYGMDAEPIVKLIGEKHAEIIKELNIDFDLEKEMDEIRQIKEACGDLILKVIIETCLLTEEEKIKMCEIVTLSGADFIKTSTGFSTGGATFEDVQAVKRVAAANAVNEKLKTFFAFIVSLLCFCLMTLL